MTMNATSIMDVSTSTMMALEKAAAAPAMETANQRNMERKAKSQQQARITPAAREVDWFSSTITVCARGGEVR